VIVLGIDNVADAGAKPLAPPPVRTALRIGALTRLGAGEARYKGVQELLELKTELDALGLAASFELMGRGTAADATPFRDRGFTVHLNASEAQRNAYLRDLDVFVSTSLWEGTNLPLVEAQAQGTPGLALDTGAHPEFTPLLFAGLRDLAVQISAYDADRDLLDRHGRMCRRFVRAQLRWSQTAEELAGLLRGTPVHRPAALPVPPPTRRGPASVVRSLRHEGLTATLRKVRAGVSNR
jgi:glycosyltransferase involved in cell wall biosynthesis